MSSHEEPEISVVIPVYRSEATLRSLTDRLRGVLEAMNLTWEIVFVDDNSPDHAWDVLTDLQRADPGHLTLVRLMRNFGQHNALMSGFHQARGRSIVTLDDDLQNPPEEIPRLYEALRAGNLDVVYGEIAAVKQHAAIRNLGSWLVTSFARLAFQTRVRVTSYRVIRREVINSILRYDLNFTYIDGLLFWCTQRIGSVPVTHDRRMVGPSGYSWRKLVTLALNLFTNFSLFPLQVVSLLGLTFSAIGLSLGTYYLILYFLGRITQAGYASIIVAIFVMSGVQLLSLGIMGEYLGRMHLNFNRKPQFVVREVVRGRPEANPRRAADAIESEGPAASAEGDRQAGPTRRP
jgi:undecaprenyl-phosphate 4-deoxy-4-formamido-L-arabinose transferase